ncbi:MAG TPA: type II toxin-antitoxin system Phd/YefM family antitoxin [Spirochaetales bacterium]|nr:type II toxin-antitoxin system Phd/YefM family antitoxin [Spirochaetales bacterium]
MRVASLAEVKTKLSTYVKEAEESGPVVITRNGKAVAVILAPVDDDDLERILLSRSPRFQALLNKSRKSIGVGNAVSHEEFWKNARQRSTDSSNAEGCHQ